MNIRTLILIAISLSLISCSSSKFITASKGYPKLNLDLTTDNISIIDDRVFISQGYDIYLPLISHPSQLYDFHPQLKEEYKDIIESTIRENSNDASKRNSSITVSIIEARKEFSANFSAEQELVAIKLKLVLEINGEKTEVIESGEFHRKSMDATNKKFEELFRKSLKEVTYNALKNIKTQPMANNVQPEALR